MKRFLLLPLLLTTVFVGGCFQTFDPNAKSILAGGQSVLAPFANPVDQVDIYRAKNVYAAALQAVVDYREYCWSRPYAVLMVDPIARPICQNRRAVVRSVQIARPKVARAIKTAETFIRSNPMLSAGSLLAAAWAAVNDFKSLVPRV